ncbi:MAG TPA: winged helix-turn-helix transcriptional regulator [Pedobacter sp.]|uniref:winged helix-turn-helix transcriptional regulator n=1 Tax=Pedobacter sp. TaxID=1411316 RepID=UPI002C4D314C|nr:winged helix-turn-helix transcriptional regulator [Pedobacter sp.]HMI03256.1 winged helix-turn-helix transcriptional regulator [Pedobacter sp.]
MRKESSTNTFNEKQIMDSCGMAYSLSIIGGRWKPAILCRLSHQKMRYSDLKNSIENISERMLIAQLRELEADQIIKRTVYPVVPPRVEYEMTDLGKTMEPMLSAMSDWGNMHRSVTEKEVAEI